MLRKKAGTICICLGLLLIAAALFLTLHYSSVDRTAGEASEEAVELLRDVILQTPVAKPDVDSIMPVQEPEETIVPDMAVTQINGYNYIGVLEFPSENFQLPVMETWSYPQLDIAPCRYSGSIYTDDLVIAGHSYPKHFGWLKDLGADEEIHFITVDQQVIRYAVDYVEILAPDQVDFLRDKTDWDLTLFTCTYGGGSRRVLRCSRLDG